MTSVSEADILSRIIEPDKAEFPAGVARVILKWKGSSD